MTPLSYRSADDARRGHTASGFVALGVSLVSPLLIGALAVWAFGLEGNPPPDLLGGLLMTLIVGCPVAALVPGIAALLTPGRHRRWPAVWGLAVSGCMLALIAMAFLR